MDAGAQFPKSGDAAGQGGLLHWLGHLVEELGCHVTAIQDIN